MNGKRPRSRNEEMYSLCPATIDTVLAQLAGKPLPVFKKADIITLSDYQTFWDKLRIEKNIHGKVITGG